MHSFFIIFDINKSKKKEINCIDANKIFVAGNSAGGFIALKTAFKV